MFDTYGDVEWIYVEQLAYFKQDFEKPSQLWEFIRRMIDERK